MEYKKAYTLPTGVVSKEIDGTESAARILKDEQDEDKEIYTYTGDNTLRNKLIFCGGHRKF